MTKPHEKPEPKAVHPAEAMHPADVANWNLERRSWFGVPLQDLTPVKRRECHFFIAHTTVLDEAERRREIAIIEASGPMATWEEYDRAVAEHVAGLVP